MLLLPPCLGFRGNVSGEQATSFNYFGGYFTKSLCWRGYREVILHKGKTFWGCLIPVLGMAERLKKNLTSPAKEFSRPDVSRPWHHRMEPYGSIAYLPMGQSRSTTMFPMRKILARLEGYCGLIFLKYISSPQPPVYSEWVANRQHKQAAAMCLARSSISRCSHQNVTKHSTKKKMESPHLLPKPL